MYKHGMPGDFRGAVAVDLMCVAVDVIRFEKEMNSWGFGGI